MVTHIPESRLVQLRAAGIADDRAAGRFVDPRVLYRCTQVLDRRGETWAASILGRNLTRRSLAAPHRPWLNPGDAQTLIAADTEEDRATIAHLDPDTGPTTGDVQ